ncbi:unnamed protein product [Rhizophagus irregularis]|nr:unnamed protein product [Rhizophagus irregularis]
MKSKCYDTEKLAELRELRIELGFHIRANKHLKGGNKWVGITFTTSRVWKYGTGSVIRKSVRSKVCIQRQRLNERNKWTKI